MRITQLFAIKTIISRLNSHSIHIGENSVLNFTPSRLFSTGTPIEEIADLIFLKEGQKQPSEEDECETINDLKLTSLKQIKNEGVQVKKVKKENKNKLKPKPIPVILREEDLEEVFARGGGKGGQAINKTMSKVILKHIPTGLQVSCQDFRVLAANRKHARTMLKEKLDEHINGKLSKRGKKMEKIRKKKAKKERKYRTANGMNIVDNQNNDNNVNNATIDADMLDDSDDDDDDEDDDDDDDDNDGNEKDEGDEKMPDPWSDEDTDTRKPIPLSEKTSNKIEKEKQI